MKSTAHFSRLVKEGRLSVVEPSVEVKEAYALKARKSLVSSKTLLELGNLEDAVALAYYSMYHMVLALLFRNGIKCENHTSAILILKEVFGIDNSLILKAKAERIDKQYYVDFSISRDEVRTAVSDAEEFLVGINEFLERLSEENIQDYRRRTMVLIR